MTEPSRVARVSADASRSIQEILADHNIASTHDLTKALEDSARAKKPLHQHLVDGNIVNKRDVLQALAHEWNVKPIDLQDVEVDPEVARLLPDAEARQYTAVPFMREEKLIRLAMADARKTFLLEDLRMRTRCEVLPYVAMPADIIKVLDHAYGTSFASLNDGSEKEMVDIAQERTKELLEDLEASTAIESFDHKTDVVEIDATAPEVERIVNGLILGALQQKASDIHVEPVQDPAGRKSRVYVRYRVDGFLKEAPYRIPWAYRSAVIAKIKIMTETMDLTERRVPQSGRIQVLAKGHPIEFRVEVVPTVHGEAAALRLLDRRNVQVDILKLGFQADTLEILLNQIKGVGGKKNYGMVLVTGPTGSGKTTTLYSCLNQIKTPEIRIVTAENPVEYNLEGIVQVEVNPDVKLAGGKIFGFATALRSFLRFDPDVIMVGEIRDKETAQIAVEAAMTGHLVFSTLHTNDAASTVIRLTEMGPPPFLVAGTVKCVVAQRLCRLICPECRQSRALRPEEITIFKAHGVPVPDKAQVSYGKGCASCGESGYHGRTGIYEIMVMDPALRQAVASGATVDQLREVALHRSPQKMRTMVQDGLSKILQGHTTMSEVLGVLTSAGAA